jgi:protein Mpv17
MSLRILLRPRITNPPRPRLPQRYNHPASPPPAAANPPPAPPPSLSLIRRVSAPVLTAFRFYGSSQRRHPWLTQIATSVTIYTLADLNAQLLFPASPDARGGGEGDEHYDYVRTLRMGLTGAILAIPVNAWYTRMSYQFAGYPRAVAVGLRVGLGQVAFAPVFLAVFFGVQGLLEGRALAEVAARIGAAGPRAWWDGLKIWPLVSTVNFYVVPLEYRALVGGLASLGWNTWLSYLNSRPVGARAGREAGEEAAREKGQAVEAVREKGQEVKAVA